MVEFTLQSRLSLCGLIIVLSALPIASVKQSTQNINLCKFDRITVSVDALIFLCFIGISFQVFITEDFNDVATLAVEIAHSYIKKNPILGLSVHLETIEGTRNESNQFLEDSKSQNYPYIFLFQI